MTLALPAATDAPVTPATPARRRSSRASQEEPTASAASAATGDTEAPAAPARPRRTARPRAAEADAPQRDAPATEPAAPGATGDTKAPAAADDAAGSRARRARRASRPAESAAPVEAPVEPDLSRQPATAAQPEAEPVEQRPAPRPSYRFNRPVRPEERAPRDGSPRPAVPVAMPEPSLTADQPVAPMGAEGGTRPQRPERGAGPAAEPYRGRVPLGRGGAQQRGMPGQGPARTSGPYSPGGRGPAPRTPGYEQPAYPPQGGAPGYGSYEPYAEYPNGMQQDRQAPVARGGRGRGAPAQPGYGEQQRGTRGPSGGRGVSEPGGRGAHPGRGIHGPADRRGGPGGRGVMGGRPGRQPREMGGYPGAIYTNVPGGPGGQPEGRYQPAMRGGAPAAVARTVDVAGILWLGGGAGMGPAEVLDGRTLLSVARMNPEDARRMGLRSGDLVSGRAEERGGRRIVVALDTVNDKQPEEVRDRPLFEQLTASFPDRRIRLEQEPQPASARVIDLFAPLGFGSRALIVAPPKTGKTTLIREAAECVLKGYPDAVVMAVLVGERPEEVTDLRARLEPRGGIVYAASFDEDTQRHAWLVQVAVERAKRVAESGRDAFMVLDSLTRLARAENLASRGQGRTLSGGIDAQALDTGRRAFGAARNLEEGGSLTILATCLVETGSRQDDVVYEEFKGTGNMELHLSRELAQRRLFPAVDAVKSGTRREEMLLTPEELRAATALRRRLADLPTAQATQQLLSVIERTPSNAALLQAIEQSGWTSGTR